jgi:beta-phosphoglucomutase
MKRFKSCIFDLDGVIVDTAKYHFIAWRRLANELGFDFTEAENEQLKGVSRVDSLNLILQWGGVSLTEAEKKDWAARKNAWYLEYIERMTPEEILPGAKDFLDALRQQGIKIALGSASKNARTILRRIGLEETFDAIIDGNQVLHGKPDPEVFLKGAAAVGVQPEDCLVFEDAEKGIEAALNGGMKAVGIGSPEVLHQANWVTPSLEGLAPDYVFGKVAAN